MIDGRTAVVSKELRKHDPLLWGVGHTRQLHGEFHYAARARPVVQQLYVGLHQGRTMLTLGQEGCHKSTAIWLRGLYEGWQSEVHREKLHPHVEFRDIGCEPRKRHDCRMPLGVTATFQQCGAEEGWRNWQGAQQTIVTLLAFPDSTTRWYVTRNFLCGSAARVLSAWALHAITRMGVSVMADSSRWKISSIKAASSAWAMSGFRSVGVANAWQECSMLAMPPVSDHSGR